MLDGRDVARAVVADAARERARGLLGRRPFDGVLVLRPAKQVHSFGMREDLDVAFVDGQDRVVAVRRLRPRRVSPLVWSATAVLEAEPGSFARWGLVVGTRAVVLS